MHKSSLDKMRRFIDLYINEYSNLKLDILDVGSQAIEIATTYKPLFFDKKNWNYVGMDMVEGNNVDICVKNPYDWKEIDSNSFDVVISGQAFEHIQYPWVTIFEIGRVLKDDGLACIIAPSSGAEHKFPFDCWRYYPDGFSSLSQYIGFDEVEVFTDWGLGKWQDSFLVMQKPHFSVEEREKFMKKNLCQKIILNNELDKINKIAEYNPISTTNYKSAIKKQSNKNAAFSVYEEAFLNSKPNSLAFYEKLGNYYIKNKNTKQAIECSQQAIKLKLESFLIYRNLGSAFQLSGKSDKAIENYYKAIDFNKNATHLYLAISRLYYNQQKLNKAIENCQKAININPNQPIKVYKNLAEMLDAQNREHEANKVRETISSRFN